MKPFNLERALAGDPVVTRGGKEVTQLTRFNVEGSYKIAAAIDGHIQLWTEIGTVLISHIEDGSDLFMKPLKGTVYLNFSKDGKVYQHASRSSALAGVDGQEDLYLQIAVPCEVEF